MIRGPPLNSSRFLLVSVQAKLRGFNKVLGMIALCFLLWLDGGASLL